MALIQCRDCEKDLSKRAYFCPHCGGYTKNWCLASMTIGVVCGLTALAAVKYLVLATFFG